LTLDQQARLEKVRAEVHAAGYIDRTDDATLVPTTQTTLTKLRFLRARKFDVNAAYTMFSDCEKWRGDFGVDELVHTFQFDEREKVNKYYPQYYHKTDKVFFDEGVVNGSWVVHYILNSWIPLIFPPCTKSPHKNVSFKKLLSKMRNSKT
jgi:CRAL/TRIO, N-terminal domain